MRYITTAHQAELNAAAKMREWGYIDATSTTGASDGGIDVRSRRALAQVKWRGGVAGRPDLQRLYGARGTGTSRQLMFFSASGYSKQAATYAKSVDITLYLYDPTVAVTLVQADTRFQGAPKQTPVVARPYCVLTSGRPRCCRCLNASSSEFAVGLGPCED